MSRTTHYWGLKIKSITNSALIKVGWEPGMYVVHCDPATKSAAPTYVAEREMFAATYWTSEELAALAQSVLPTYCPDVETVIVKFTMTTSESEA